LADAIDLARLRARMQNILTSSACKQIRFKMANIHIQTFMYGYIAGSIDNGRVRVQIGKGDYGDIDSDRHTYILTLSSADAAPNVIVHECTHAVIWATQIGLTLTKETHEAAAYLADSMYEMLCGRSAPDTQVAGLTGPVARLARQAVDFNKSHDTTFVCPPSDVELIKAIYKRSPLGAERTWTQGGLGDDKPRLPRWLQGWWAVYTGTYWYYHFSATGVAVTKIKPAGASAPPPNSPDKGQVNLSTISPHVVVSWSPGDRGQTIEKFTRVGGSSETEMNGVSNAGPPLLARKM
jgi:hypothetical protein